MRLQGRVAVVTGSGRGIGRAIAHALAKEGAAVVVNDVDREVAEKVVNEITGLSGRATPCIAAVGTKAAADALLDTALSKFGGLDILVNNAGITRDAMLHRVTEEQWDAVINTHLKGTFFNGQAAAIVMMEKHYGKIINVTSTAGTRGNMGQSNYAAAKMGIIGLTLTWAKELARHHINVNCISPSAVTDMTLSMPDKVRAEVFAKIARESVLGEYGGPEEIAPAAVFLASDEARYVTGQVLGVTGSSMQVL